MVVVGVDTGGTFTDCICRDATGFRVWKLPSTPDNPARAVRDGLAGLGVTAELVVHGRMHPLALRSDASQGHFYAYGREQGDCQIMIRHLPCLWPRTYYGITTDPPASRRTAAARGDHAS